MKKSVDIIIFGGQSNMQGQTESLPKNNNPVEKAKEYRFLEDEFVPLKHPVGEDLRGEKWCAAASMGYGSLVPAFCRSYIEKTGRDVVAIHAARGSTVLGEWLHGTQFAYNARRKIARGIKKAKDIYDVERIYYVWLQGESDALIHTGKDEYCARLIEYKNQLKERFQIDKFGIIKMGYFLADGAWSLNPEDTQELRIAYNEEIMNAQELAVNKDEDFVMLTRICTELSMDSEFLNPNAEGHYNNKAMKIIGEKAGYGLAEIRK